MVDQQQKLMLSPYMEIYESVVPRDYLLRQIKELADFGFIYDELIEYLFLKSIDDLYHIDVAERSKYDMSFKYFPDMSPEETVINTGSLTRSRKPRLKDMELSDLLTARTVQIALDKEIIKSESIIVDATHTKSRYSQKNSALQFMKWTKQ